MKTKNVKELRLLVESMTLQCIKSQNSSIGLDENHKFTEAVNFGTCREF